MTRFSSYNLRTYILDNVFPLVVFTAFGALMTGMLTVLGVALDAIVFLGITLVLTVCMILVWGYLRRAKYWHDIEDVAGSIDRIEHFDDLIGDPTFLDGKIAKAAMDELVKCSEDEITQLNIDSNSTRQYIERWVHEVKTPIATTKLILGESHGEQADLLKRELERIERLVEQALYSARADSLSKDYLIRDTRLLGVIGDACKSNMQLLTAKGIKLEMDVPSDLVVLADKTWLEFILSQVLVNSAKYDATEISFVAHDSNDEDSAGKTILEIRDNGCGIPSQDVPRVFDRGFTGEVGRSHGSATGMGLYLVARMCSQMGIGISLASEEDSGTRVIFSFPHDNRKRRLSKNLTVM